MTGLFDSCRAGIGIGAAEGTGDDTEAGLPRPLALDPFFPCFPAFAAGAGDPGLTLFSASLALAFAAALAAFFSLFSALLSFLGL